MTFGSGTTVDPRGRSGYLDRVAACEVCGHGYDALLIVTPDGTAHSFDSFECAIQALAPTCPTCGTRVLGKGVVGSGQIYCSRHCGGESVMTEGYMDN